MKLFQYWDTGAPPDDVAECIESVRAMNPEFRHRLFDRDTAAWFIGKRLGQRHRAAFEALAVPAMQADYFRLCALWAKGGAWIDADTIAIQPARSLFAQSPGGYVSMWNGRLQNHVLMTPRAGCPFFGASVRLATRQIEERTAATAYEVTGPRVLNLIWAVVDPEGVHEDPHLARNQDTCPTPHALSAAADFPGAREAFLALHRRHDFYTNQWLRRIEDAAYKQTSLDWRNWTASPYLPVG